MKHLKRIFENRFIFKNEDIKGYIEDCFLEISENPNFEVDDLLEVINTRSKLVNVYIYKLHIELGKSLTLPQPISSNIFIGMVETNLEFLKLKNEKLTELYNDIEVAINRIKGKFDSKCSIEIKANRREEIEITILVDKN
jgi:hypothetical protein